MKPFLSARSLLVALGLSGLAVAGQSCSDGDSVTGSSMDSPDASSGGAGGSTQVDASAGADGAVGGRGGNGASVGGGGRGGSDAAADSGSAAFPGETVVACPGAQRLDVEALGFPACPSCAGAVCVPADLLAGFSSGADLLGSCDDGPSKCVPMSYVATAGSFRFKTCTAFGQAEGRCVSKCIPQVANQPGLEQDVCGANELCAPCFMPTDGSATGACGLGCDPGPSEPPFLFETCCGGQGVCVPSDIVPAEQARALDPGSCTGEDQLCVPSKFIDPGYRAPVCDSVGGVEGRCVAACIGQIADQASLLPQADCPVGELCAPCYDPRTGEATGACSINGDNPVDPPVVFSECCDGGGLCVPTTAVPQEQVGALGVDSCTGLDEVCAPAEFVDPTYVAPTCTSVAGAEGRCIAECLPQLESQGAFLPQDTCEAGKLCAPCYDPLTGELTGACNVNGDSPDEPAVVFGSCCNDLGKCIPESAVPVAQRGALSADVCAGPAELCAPTKFIDSTFVPQTCRSLSDTEGRCVPACTAGSLASYLPRDVCDVGEVCAPCYNPGDGSATGACSVNGDSPTEPAVLFAECCSGDGRCVPETVVPVDQRSQLTADVCATDGAESALCAPMEEVLGITPPSDCIFPGNPSYPSGPGACFNPCLVPALAGLDPAGCGNGKVCIPCFNSDGSPTGSCAEPLPGADAGTDGG